MLFLLLLLLFLSILFTHKQLLSFAPAAVRSLRLVSLEASPPLAASSSGIFMEEGRRRRRRRRRRRSLPSLHLPWPREQLGLLRALHTRPAVVREVGKPERRSSSCIRDYSDVPADGNAVEATMI